ncbi:hypothetical protein COLO4_08057 [Corchorus olitorius]|uniref:Pentatricopeptide repeat-containing protein n=1 Tax=Corchorus olitorius TaxID=93759 RepID=A0A1R3KHL2_9ROSI|nr:hypothetical protein COLO4_08057 [Corchorus olitorius]
MKRVFKISDAAAAQSELLFNLHRQQSNPKALTPRSFCLPNSSLYRCYGDLGSQIKHSPLPTKLPLNIIDVFIQKLSLAENNTRIRGVSEDLIRKVVHFRDELVERVDSSEEVTSILDEKSLWLLRQHHRILLRKRDDDRAFTHLLKKLYSSPNLAMEVFNWRRVKADEGYPMTPEEYATGITIAGKIQKVDLAAELFREAASKQLNRTCLYNALMGAYMYNGFTEKCQLVFRDLKRNSNCRPSIVTYNILISVFGRLMLIDHMEATYQEIQNLNLSPTLSTYNNLIAAYLTAWMWDNMERTFQLLRSGPLKPDINTHLLMLRGYAHSGKLDRMEETYQIIKDHVDKKEFPLIRSMICAYCKSSVKDRTKRIEELLSLIPENEYRPWLNALLIRHYAQENCLETMENLINEAFERKTCILSTALMNCVLATYFRYNAVDRLADFVKRAECAGWRICRSVYHCKMVMYGSQNRLEEMENVLNEMNNMKVNYTKKTFCILYKAYLMCGERHKTEQVLGLMCKNGYWISLDAIPL